MTLALPLSPMFAVDLEEEECPIKSLTPTSMVLVAAGELMQSQGVFQFPSLHKTRPGDAQYWWKKWMIPLTYEMGCHISQGISTHSLYKVIVRIPCIISSIINRVRLVRHRNCSLLSHSPFPLVRILVSSNGHPGREGFVAVTTGIHLFFIFF